MRLRKTANLLMLLAALNGCAAKQSNVTNVSKEFATFEDARKKLGLDTSQIRSINGYKISRFSDPRLRTIAGIYAGTVKVKKTDNGYMANGVYSQFENPEAMERACKEADINGDFVITNKELRDLELNVYEKYAE